MNQSWIIICAPSSREYWKGNTVNDEDSLGAVDWKAFIFNNTDQHSYFYWQLNSLRTVQYKNESHTNIENK